MLMEKRLTNNIKYGTIQAEKKTFSGEVNMGKKRAAFLLSVIMIMCGMLPSAMSEGGVTVPEITYINQYEIPDNEAMAFLKKMGVG